MKKFKAAPQSAKRIKAIVAAAMALTLAVPTTAYLSSKAPQAEAEEAVPEAVATIDFEKGFRGEKETSGLTVVKSEGVLIFKELRDENEQDIYDGLAVVYDVTDEPVIEADEYKYGAKGNQPSTAYDENLGSVLVFDDTVVVDEFAKKAEDAKTDVAIGTVLQKATIAHSQVQINNPFAGKDLSNGATVSYWVKVPATKEDATKGANSTMLVFGVKDTDNRKADANVPAEKEAEKEAESKLSIQITANNDFHYVTPDVSVAFEGDGQVLAAPDTWKYVTVTMTEDKIVTYVDGVETANKEVTAAGITAVLADANTGVFFGGNYSTAAETVGQNVGTVRNTCMDEVSFYTSALTADEVKKVYDVVKSEVDTVETPVVLEKFTFENGMTGDKGTTINGLESNKVDPTVVVDAERGNVLKMDAGTASKSAGGVLSANPFAGKDINGATVSYWVKEPANAKLKTVVPSVSLSFIDEPKKVSHPKLYETYENDMTSTVIYTQTDMEAYFWEAYTTEAYKSLQNHYWFRTRRNTHIDAKTDSEGKIQDALYDVIAVEKQKEYEEMLKGMSEWHFVTAVFTNAGIKMYLDGEELTNNWAEPEGRPEFFGPRFFDGYYQMQFDGYAPFYRATDNQGARTVMNFLTADDTSAYLGYMYQLGKNSALLRTYEAYYDDITYYGSALTSAQIKELYENPDPIQSAEPQPSVAPTDVPTDAPTSGPGVSAEPVTPPGVVTPPSVSKDDGSIVAPKNAYSGKTGDTSNVVVPVVAIVVAATAFAVVSKKRKETEV